MATKTTEKKFKRVRLFKVSRELNINTEKIVSFLEEHDYGEAISGKGLNASITDEEAYLALREEFADDAEAAARVRELRARSDEETAAASHDEVARLEGEEAPEPSAGEETAEAQEAVSEAAAEATEAAPVDGAEAEAAEATAAEATAEATAAEATEEAEAAGEEAVAAENEPTPEAKAEAVEAEEKPDEEAEATAEEETEAVAGEEGEAKVERKAERAEAESPTEEGAEAEAKVPSADEASGGTAEEGSEAVSEADETAPETEEAKTEDEPEAEDASKAEGTSEEEDTAEQEDGTLKADRYRLKGTNVVGKVDLGKFKKRKRKRKRKRKQTSKKRTSRKQKSRKKKKSKRKRRPAEKDVEETLQETLRELEQGASRVRQRRRQRRRNRHEREREMARARREERENILRVTEYVSAGELANLMDESVNDLIKTLFDSGMMVSINQRLDADTISFLADEYGYEVEFTTDFGAAEAEIELEEDAEEDLKPRAPVVTVMGHVDHGKTSLLDYVRKTNAVAGEAGGITQHVGAYSVELPSSDWITFLDTPGHEAFTAMRARGAKATDVVILVVAADDAVMPQTREAINHAQAADVPLVVAINKMDLPDADEQRVMQQLSEENVLVEQYGGTVQCAAVSAKTGEGIEDLLEKVVLEAELRELEANPNRNASGVVIESRLEKGRGNVVTVLVQNGTLRVGDPFIAGAHSGRVRAMFDERDNRIEEVGPSKPALVLGSSGGPEVGDQFIVFDEESKAREVAQSRQQIYREQALRQKKHITLDEIGRRLALGEFHELNLIIKGDVGGSVEALSDALLELSTEEVVVNIVHSGVGAVTESDVMLATASDAVIIGFQVRPTSGARRLAKTEEIDIRPYSIIYDAIEDVRDALEGMLSPEEREETLGTAEVRQLFKVPRVGTVAGCRVVEGRIGRNDHIRVVRDGVVMYEGEISSLKHHKDDVGEVQSGYECGLSVEGYNDIKAGDELEAYRIIEVKRKLETSSPIEA